MRTMPFSTRTRLLILSGAAFGLFVACSALDSRIEPCDADAGPGGMSNQHPSSNAGRGGHGGSSGVAADALDAGPDASLDGGDVERGGSSTGGTHTGGTSGSGGSHDNGGGGTGGNGGTPPTATCGNHQVEGSEECDDGNTDNGDGCSSECKNEACTLCTNQKCTDSKAGCSIISDATGKGQCQAVLDCAQSTNCTSGVESRACYCGTVDFTACFDVFATPDQPNGPCKAQIVAAAGTENPLQVGTKYFYSDTSDPFTPPSPLGAAMQHLLCQAQECAEECNITGAGGMGAGGAGGTGGASGNGGESTGGTGGANDGGSGGTVANSGDPTACHACEHTYCSTLQASETTACAGNAACDALLTCVDTTGCATNAFDPCYCGDVVETTCYGLFTNESVPDGLCKTEVTDLAGSTIPSDIGFDKTVPSSTALGYIVGLLGCAHDHCRQECGYQFDPN